MPNVDNPGPVARVPVRRRDGESVVTDFDIVAEEVPVALEYNGISHAVLLASPLDLEDLAVGFTLTEGIADTVRDISDVEITAVDDGIRVAVRIGNHCFARLKEARRSMAGRTGCGLCGIESLRHVRRRIPPVAPCAAVSVTSLQIALGKLGGMQDLHRTTGATHAAAWVLPDGEIACIREDVGRHNALDKLIGALVRDGSDFAQGAVLVTSRASYEIVQKAASAGIGAIAAISAPTALAIHVAEELNVALIGFFRPDRHVLYATPKPLCQATAASSHTAR